MFSWIHHFRILWKCANWFLGWWSHNLGMSFRRDWKSPWYWHDNLPVLLSINIFFLGCPPIFRFYMGAPYRISGAHVTVVMYNCSNAISGRVKWYGAVHKLEGCWAKEGGGDPTWRNGAQKMGSVMQKHLLECSLLCTLLCTFHCWLWVCKVLFLCKLLLNVDMGLLLDFYLSHLLLNFRWVLTGIFLLRKSCFVLNDCIMVVCDFFSRLGRSYSRFKVVSCCIFLWNCSFGSSIDN